ncbi:MAG: multicopper oxidase domain-containing protein [Bacteroidetes bacterium]|nr:multicopper oxidase domain-containing protein [Bacteroidota bacterium]
MSLTRRTFLARTAAAIAAQGALRTGVVAQSLLARSRPAGSGNPLRIPKEIPGGNLAISTTSVQMLTGAETAILSINAEFPAPTIRVKKGDTFSANIINNLTTDVVLHWHGQHVPSIMDGQPSQPIHAGASATVTFPVVNRAGTYFYHAHTDMITAEQVYRGLAGLFIVDDDEEGALPLPRGEYDIPLAISDRRIDSNNQLVYSPTDDDHRTGYVGETICVNGTPSPFLEVAPTLYRFRILNASNARIYQLAFDDNSTFRVTASDGGLLASPIATQTCFLAPGERVEIVADFSKLANGSAVKLKSLPFFHDGPQYAPLPQGAEFDIIRFDVTKTGDSKSSLPSTLSSITPYVATDAVEQFTWELGVDGMDHTINGKAYAMDRIDHVTPYNTLARWTFSNTFTTEFHPMHVHGTQFQIVSRTGGELMPSDQGWKDTVLVRPGEAVDVLVKFADYWGTYLVHCHNLEHEDHGMMANFMVDNAGAVREDSKETGGIELSPNPAMSDVTISLPNERESEWVELCDLRGRVIRSARVSTGASQVVIAVADLANGDYIIRCGAHVAKLVVLR